MSAGVMESIFAIPPVMYIYLNPLMDINLWYAIIEKRIVGKM